MEYIDISRRKLLEGSIHKCSSEMADTHSAKYLLVEQGYWSSQKRPSPVTEHFSIDYHRPEYINFIRLDPSPSRGKYFPAEFRIEASLDGETWKVIRSEKNFTLETDFYHIDVPIMQIRYLRVTFLELHRADGSYVVEIGRCLCGIAGVSAIETTSTAQGNDAKNLFNPQVDTYWESEAKPNGSIETVFIDLGQVSPVSKIVLGSSIKGFPEDFSIIVSADSDIWVPLIEERSFKSEPFKKYYWDIDITPAKMIRIESRTVSYSGGQFAVRFSEIQICAAPFNPFHSHNMADMVQHASVFQSGIVKLASDGDQTPGAVVQGSDRRLRDATTVFKGIVQFSEDGDDLEFTAVQASDTRLKTATELRPGIVRLAYDRETSPGAAVQSNDSRITEATEKNFGIVKICPPGLYSENSVITGNDPRLHQATTSAPGICVLSPNGGEKPGTVVQADDRRLRDATTLIKGIVRFAEDGETSEETAVQGADRRLRDATTTAKGIVELAENGEDRPGVAVQGDDRRLKDASESAKGIVRLSKDGEDSPLTAVQGNDRRLKDASESAKGIVRLSKDGEDSPLTAVQGNDRRLKNATTVTRGIIELAEDGEDSPGVVVQGNDRRLRDATTTTKGIVELAEDGEDRPGVAIQGDDRRLKDATEKIKGIMRFASNGEDSILTAVQGNDRRLRDATTTAKGIVELAEDGEDRPGIAVQGDDRRLKDATTTSRGIVELAENGEDSAGVAVQGNDRRLMPASEENTGIVRLAKSNEIKPGVAVQANDPRLYNQREPLPHTHEYALLEHEFSSHTGSLSVRQSKNETFREITPPSDRSSVIHGHNDSKLSGSIGVAGVAGAGSQDQIHTYGVVGHGGHVGVRGQSSGNETVRGCGVLGISRFGAGGVFSSEHDFSLVAEGYGSLEAYDKSLSLMGNGRALLVKGHSEFHGRIALRRSPDDTNQSSPMNIVEYFEVDDEEYLSAGDILVASETGKSVLSRSRKEYNRAVIGLISGNPSLSVDNSGSEKKIYPVALAGKAMCKVDARNKPVNAGDFIVTSNTPGCGMSGSINSFERIGTVIGKALDGLDNGIGIVPVFIVHM